MKTSDEAGAPHPRGTAISGRHRRDLRRRARVLVVGSLVAQTDRRHHRGVCHVAADPDDSQCDPGMFLDDSPAGGLEAREIRGRGSPRSR